ncbi:MAG: hypothetical protein CMF12_01095 [Idiomarina sp.]|uniref:conjugative transfer protein MobI(A/C) n=1 Tax=Idiomarina sp. TaxID=1874361 RepID=UPI000C5B06D4|nr:conjugative transfer protein MobI(A/C) [Idiomarina sp.]MBT41096.1 hypothetical protein [Idiomarina sp.]
MSKLSQQAIDVLEAKVQALESFYSNLVQIAQLEIDRYWAVFKLRNKSILNSRSRGETDAVVGRLAPRVHKYRDRNAVRIEWVLFEPSPLRLGTTKGPKNTRQFSNAIPEPQKGFKPQTFRKHRCQEWEIKMALESERLLSPIRKVLKQTKQEIKSVKVQIKELKSSFEENQNG